MLYSQSDCSIGNNEFSGIKDYGKKWYTNNNDYKDRAYSYYLPKLHNDNFFIKRHGQSPFYFLSYDGTTRFDIKNGTIYEEDINQKFYHYEEDLILNPMYYNNLGLAELPIILEDLRNLLESFDSEVSQIVYNIKDGNTISSITKIWSDGLIIETWYSHKYFKNKSGEELIEHYPNTLNYYHSFEKPFLRISYEDDICNYCNFEENSYNAKRAWPGNSKSIVTFHDNSCISSIIKNENSHTQIYVYPKSTKFTSPTVEAKLFLKERGAFGNPYYELMYTNIDKEKSIDKEGYISSDLIFGEFIIDEYNLIEYWNLFIQFCNNHGISLKETPNDINIYFDNLPKGVLAEAHAIDDNKILIKVNPDEWKNSSNQKKIYIMFHELFHDAFNLRHGYGGKMMFCYAEKEYSWYNLFNDTVEILDFLKSKHGMKSLNNYFVVDKYH
tara:strand:- start:111 stop:1433 length:1323 start_codon:yes stop_codon:yes gene_type:complete